MHFIFMYPIIGNWYSEYTSQITINQYNNVIKNTSKETLNKISTQAAEYNKAIAEGTIDNRLPRKLIFLLYKSMKK